jgi:hypothetical protein
MPTVSERRIKDMQLEIRNLRAALSEMIEITKRNSEPGLMLIAIRKCAEQALSE